jgi:hypothetical protein
MYYPQKALELIPKVPTFILFIPQNTYMKIALFLHCIQTITSFLLSLSVKVKNVEKYTSSIFLPDFVFYVNTFNGQDCHW